MTQPLQSEHDSGPHVGGYRLLHRIGEGGMGVVHLAEGADGDRVALKVLRPHVVGDDEGRARLAREVSSLRRVRSPWVAEVLDADPWGQTPYVATRHVDGPSLHEHVRLHGPVLGEDLRQLATGLAEALVAVHRVGVLHRDVKPSNVLIERGSPVLIDFGLARLADDPRLTQTGWLLGTPGYLAPEILYGDDATTASDVHSWAATVVYAATGRPPFGTGPAMAIMDRVRRGEHDLSAVPTALLPLVHACLDPEPTRRPSLPQLLATLPGGAPAASRFGGSEARTISMPMRPAPSPAPDTRAYTVATQQRPGPWQQAARAPYMQPPPPRHQPATAARPATEEPARPHGSAGAQAVTLLTGLFGTVAVGFAAAPYVALAVLGVLALAVRTVSWTTESARDRQQLRGRRRWWDRPMTAMTSPWYLVVATGGTLLLLAWSALVALVVGFGYLLFGGPLVPGLLLMGAALGVSLWWGPGSRRIRRPTRRLLRGVTRRPWTGWLSLLAVVAAVGLCAVALADGVVWDPQPGPPWRDGTWLGTLLSWL